MNKMILLSIVWISGLSVFAANYDMEFSYCQDHMIFTILDYKHSENAVYTWKYPTLFQGDPVLRITEDGTLSAEFYFKPGAVGNF